VIVLGILLTLRREGYQGRSPWLVRQTPRLSNIAKSPMLATSVNSCDLDVTAGANLWEIDIVSSPEVSPLAGHFLVGRHERRKNPLLY
jgi:hypothetical protein